MRILSLILFLLCGLRAGAQTDKIINKRHYDDSVKIVKLTDSYLYCFKITDPSRELIKLNRNFIKFKDLEDAIQLPVYTEQDFAAAPDRTDAFIKLEAGERSKGGFSDGKEERSHREESPGFYLGRAGKKMNAAYLILLAALPVNAGIATLDNKVTVALGAIALAELIAAIHFQFSAAKDLKRAGKAIDRSIANQ